MTEVMLILYGECQYGVLDKEHSGGCRMLLGEENCSGFL